ncbi:MAG: glutaredoxin family protein [Zoogloeaceae bacterium]|nr:glutaredoxin family protein [Zoogloeaceae bacterium]
MNRLLITVLLAAVLQPLSAVAQATYRWVDPATGRSVFSDQPPPLHIKSFTREGAAASNERQQPYATKIAAEKFPVVVYTAADCIEVCQQARSLLNGRGVPFTEKMVSGEGADFDALKALTGGEASVPFLTVGSQKFKGFEASAWNNLLDLAGYPKTALPGAPASGSLSR